MLKAWRILKSSTRCPTPLPVAAKRLEALFAAGCKWEGRTERGWFLEPDSRTTRAPWAARFLDADGAQRTQMLDEVGCLLASKYALHQEVTKAVAVARQLSKPSAEAFESTWVKYQERAEARTRASLSVDIAKPVLPPQKIEDPSRFFATFMNTFIAVVEKMLNLKN